MAIFKYTAVDADGRSIKSTIEGISRASAENELLRQDLKVTSIRQKKRFSEIEISPERVPRQEVMHFSRQIAAFVRTGIPIIEAVSVVEQGSGNKRFKAILAEVREALESGVPFSEALSPHASVFPSYYLGILRSAELTGQLDTVLDQLSTYIQRDLESRARIKQALTYPVIVMMLSVVTMVVMVTVVLPKFVDFFDDVGSDLPLPTRLLLDASSLFSTYWWVLLIVIGVLVAAHIAIGRFEKTKVMRARFLLALPVLGPIIQFSAVERFCRIVAAMMRAGVPLPETMAAAIDSTNNALFQQELRVARDEMLEGDGIAGPLDRTDLFPVAAVQMIRVGEETGTLDQQVDSAASFYETETEFKLKRLTDLFEPAVIVFMGVVVGFVAVALISAMYGVAGGLKDEA